MGQKLTQHNGENLVYASNNRGSFHCPVCGYRGHFTPHPRSGRPNASCAHCGARERHRMMALYLGGTGQEIIEGARVLHISPDEILSKYFETSKEYITSDLIDPSTDLTLDVVAMDLPDSSFDMLICSHVLEHVSDDTAAVAEMYRVLTPGGTALVCVPVIQGWLKTYENPNVTKPEDRFSHFGHIDHVRYYGRDIAERLGEPGFEVTEFQASPEQCVNHATHRGSSLYLAFKS